ncbi:GNAT family N-acetyltransferase [Candidatus Parcubacteria bacterium]|jgi:hypothetical protein|nr:MAG: GNAT family N-acetyltransferase [Candidatus Parcubacteria bacterium]
MGYSIRQFQLSADKDDLFELWEAVLLNSNQERMRRMYSDNSYGVPLSWLVISDEEAKPVGSVSAFPRQLIVEGAEYRMGVNCDMLMLKAHRTLGPALMALKSLIKGCSGQGYHFILAMPNKKSQPVFKRVGYKKIGTAYRWTKILRSEEKLSRYIKYVFLQKTMSRCIDDFLNYISFESWIRIWRYKLWNYISHEKNEPIEKAQFIDEIDFSPELGTTSGFLKWRYSKSICKGNPSIFNVSCNQNIIGLIVYTLNDTEVIVQDAIFIHDDEKEAELLVSKFIHKMRSLGYASISVLHFGAEHFEKLLQKFGFIKRGGRDVFVNDLSVKTPSHLPMIFKKISWFEGTLDL